MSRWTIAVVAGVVWPAVALVVCWRVRRRLQAEGDRCPPADGGVVLAPAFVCPGCAECSAATT